MSFSWDSISRVYETVYASDSDSTRTFEQDKALKKLK